MKSRTSFCRLVSAMNIVWRRKGEGSSSSCGVRYNVPMTVRSIATIVLSAAGFIFLSSEEAVAQGSAVRVLVSNGMKAALEELQPQCERAIGHPLALQYNSTLSVKKMIEAGEGFDVTLITTEAIDDLIKKGKLAG